VATAFDLPPELRGPGAVPLVTARTRRKVAPAATAGGEGDELRSMAEVLPLDYFSVTPPAPTLSRAALDYLPPYD